MSKINTADSIQNNLRFGNNIWNYKFIFISLIIFVISLPFNRIIEWDLIHISRFEIKLTVITFSLLFIAWLGYYFKFPRRRTLKEKIFYTFVALYAISQFTSLLNSPVPSASIIQGIIISFLMIMMIVVSETILDKRIAKSVLISIGILSLIIGITVALDYYLFSTQRLRLGDHRAAGLIDLGGDVFYLADILLFSIGAVFLVIFNLPKKKYWKWLKWSLLLLWFSAIALTCTKSLFVAVISFFVCLILILKRERRFLVTAIVLFIISIILNFEGPTYFYTMKSKVAKRVVMASKKTMPEFQEEIPKIDQPEIPPHIAAGRTAFRKKINPLDREGGGNSLLIRAKAIVVSLGNSMEHFWFGHGAGLARALLPKMGDEFDRNASEKLKEFMKRKSIYGPNANFGFCDAHNLFLAEFFTGGVAALIPLMCFTIFVVIEQMKTLKVSYNKNDNINEVLFATLIAMLVFRMGSALVVFPFLWFMLGLCFGVSKLYRINYK